MTAELPHADGADPARGTDLTPWGTAYYPGGLLALTVDRDATATGRIIVPASFMWLRASASPATPSAGSREVMTRRPCPLSRDADRLAGPVPSFSQCSILHTQHQAAES
jgi:hypothetical protein